MDIKLIAETGTHPGQEIPIDVREFVIGRAPSCHYRIDRDRVSHRHCLIRHQCGRVTIEDLGSTNGTMLNDRRIHTAEVQDGDRLKVGPARFRFAIALESEDVERWIKHCILSAPCGHARRSAVDGTDDDLFIEGHSAAVERSMPCRWSGRGEPGGGTTTGFARPIAASVGRPRPSPAASATIAMCRADPAHLGDGAEGDAPPPIPRAAAAQGPSTPPLKAPEPGGVEPDPEVGLPLGMARGSRTIRLIVRCERSKEKAIAIEGPRFVIGRDSHCQLRPHSPLVSRMHAAIERRDGRVFVRDLETRNGTVHNGRLLRSEEAEAFDGDRLEIGPLTFTFQIGPLVPDIPPKVDELVAHWLLEEDGVGPGPPAPPDLPSSRQASPAHPLGDRSIHVQHLTYEFIQDILVVTPLTPDLDDDSAVGPIRLELATLLEQLQPRRVVINLDQVTRMTRGAAVMLMARHCHFGKVGGMMRLCHLRPAVITVLEQIHALALIEDYPTVDEAILAAWV